MSKGLVVGFTGTQRGMTAPQAARVRTFLESGIHPPILEARHGDCIGADAEFDLLLEQHGIHTLVHPPKSPSKRAFCLKRWIASESRARSVVEVEPREYLERNRAIVDACGVLIAAPGETTEQLRSGTWSTVRYARKTGKPVRVVLPNGEVVK